MGWSFRKSFKVIPGVRLNLSRRGLGMSVGIKGLRLGVGGGRKPRLTGGVGPFRYYQSLGGSKARRAPRPPALPPIDLRVNSGSGTTATTSTSFGTLCKGMVIGAVVLLLGLLSIGVLANRSASQGGHSLADAPSASTVTVSQPVPPPQTQNVAATIGPRDPAPPPASPGINPTAQKLRPQPTPPLASFAQRVQASQQAAVAKYPELGKAGSPFNQKFLYEYTRQRVARGKALLSADWPLWLADQCAARLRDPALPPIPLEPAPSESAQMAESMPTTAAQSSVAAAQVAAIPAPASDGSGPPYGAGPRAGDNTVHVSGYYRKDGTYVQPHTRRAPSRH